MIQWLIETIQCSCCQRQHIDSRAGSRIQICNKQCMHYNSIRTSCLLLPFHEAQIQQPDYRDLYEPRFPIELHAAIKSTRGPRQALIEGQREHDVAHLKRLTQLYWCGETI